MGNIINDIVEDIQVKPNNSKIVLKWVVRIAVLVIGIAFAIGEFKVKTINKIDTIEKQITSTKNDINILQEKVNTLDSKVDNNYILFMKELMNFYKEKKQ